MTDQHPITPPPELIKEWIREANHNEQMFPQVAILAARWGADQELEACCEWFQEFYKGETWVLRDYKTFHSARRPRPPSLKEQALDSWDRLRNEAWCQEIDSDLGFIRRALEALPE